MASAQEFESPGAHMVSISSKPVGIQSKNTIVPGSIASSFGPPVYYGSDSDSVLYAGSGASSRKTTGYYREGDIDDYLEPYIKYNSDLFNRAMDYDQMMSNTSIRRQMEDLKSAGINPILAGRLGGAQYKGVSAPYITINPASVLSAYATFQGNELNYKARMEEIASREKISENELKNRMEIAEKEIFNALNIAGLNAKNLKEIAEKNNLTEIEINEMTNAVKVEIQDMYNSVLEEINQNDIDTQKEISRNSNITKIIATGLGSIGLVASGFIRAHYFSHNSLVGLAGMRDFYNAGLFDINRKYGGYN